MALAIGGVTPILASCSDPSDYFCGPARLQVEPSVVRPGDTVEVSAPAAQCDLGLGSDASYEIQFIQDDGPVGGVTQVPVSDQGEFSAQIVVPDDTQSGWVLIHVEGSTLDGDCDDTGSCADYTVNIEVQTP